MTSYQYSKTHCGDTTKLRPSYLHNGISYTGKMTSLYWIRALGSSQGRRDRALYRLLSKRSDLILKDEGSFQKINNILLNGFNPYCHTPLPQWSWKRYTGFPRSVRLSVRPSVDGIVSALYLPQYSRIHFIFAHILHVKQLQKVCRVLFFYESIVWVILERLGVFSERTRSGCSSVRINLEWGLTHCGLTNWPSVCRRRFVSI